VDKSIRSAAWQRWVRQPQTVRLRKAVFQIHLWSGIALGLYIFFISVTGSVLVYRNELYVWATPESGSFTDSSIPMGIRLVSTLMELHDNLLGGDIGRSINGLGGAAVLLVALTGLVIWWPGIRRWRRSLTIRRGVGWKRFIWDLHSAIGLWTVGATLVFAISGIYLCFPELFHAAAESIEPMTIENAGRRLVDDVLYWLAFLHFGRINGIGIPCDGPGVCDQTVKAIWALFGLVPAVMFVTGATMWWNRVVRRWRRQVGATGRQAPAAISALAENDDRD
jgi:uncharacterized iron-regulated membrane protein